MKFTVPLLIFIKVIFQKVKGKTIFPKKTLNNEFLKKVMYIKFRLNHRSFSIDEGTEC